MDTPRDPRDSPGVPLADAVQAEVDRYLHLSEQRARADAKRKPQSPEQKTRALLRSRLRTLGQKIEALADQVEWRQGDRSGHSHWGWMKPPADNSDLRGASPTRPGMLDSWERVEREAAEGCELSAEFVAEFGPMLRLALELRHERPPPRALDYDPMEDMPESARQHVARSRVY